MEFRYVKIIITTYGLKKEPKITQVASSKEKPSVSHAYRLILGKWVGFFLQSCALSVKNWKTPVNAPAPILFHRERRSAFPTI